MTGPARVLIVANRTAATDQLVEAVKRRASAGPAEFHLLVPATPRGLHRVIDPEDAGKEEAALQLERGRVPISDALRHEITGQPGDSDPGSAISDTWFEHPAADLTLPTLPAPV